MLIKNVFLSLLISLFLSLTTSSQAETTNSLIPSETPIQITSQKNAGTLLANTYENQFFISSKNELLIKLDDRSNSLVTLVNGQINPIPSFSYTSSFPYNSYETVISSPAQDLFLVNVQTECLYTQGDGCEYGTKSNGFFLKSLYGDGTARLVDLMGFAPLPGSSDRSGWILGNKKNKSSAETEWALFEINDLGIKLKWRTDILAGFSSQLTSLNDIHIFEGGRTILRGAEIGSNYDRHPTYCRDFLPINSLGQIDEPWLRKIDQMAWKAGASPGTIIGRFFIEEQKVKSLPDDKYLIYADSYSDKKILLADGTFRCVPSVSMTRDSNSHWKIIFNSYGEPEEIIPYVPKFPYFEMNKKVISCYKKIGCVTLDRGVLQFQDLKFNAIKELQSYQLNPPVDFIETYTKVELIDKSKKTVTKRDVTEKVSQWNYLIPIQTFADSFLVKAGSGNSYLVKYKIPKTFSDYVSRLEKKNSVKHKSNKTDCANMKKTNPTLISNAKCSKRKD